MEKALSPTRGERTMRLFHDHDARARQIGISRQLIEDDALAGGIIHLDGREYATIGLCSCLGLDADDRLKEGARHRRRTRGQSRVSTP